jgi:DNA relaxase NicK
MLKAERKEADIEWHCMLEEVLDGCIRQRTTQIDFTNDFPKAVWSEVSAGKDQALISSNAERAKKR